MPVQQKCFLIFCYKYISVYMMDPSADMKNPRAPNALRNTVLVFALVIGAIKGGQWLLLTCGHSDFFRAYAALVFVGAPFIYLRLANSDISLLGFRGDRVGKDIAAAALFGFPIIAVYVAAWLSYHQLLLGKQVSFQVNVGIILVIVEQACAVSLPEELFFRGFCQGMLSRRKEDRRPGFQIMFSPSVIIPSLLFAAAHFITEPRINRLATFLPALLFGYLRSRYNSIIPCVVVHAAANVAVFILAGSV
jgi:membrane protease YdiL (CAAX protease family)